MSKYRYIGPDLEVEVDGKIEKRKVNAYGGNLLNHGDVIELEGHLASKAEKNPNYELVKPRGPKPKQKETFIEEGNPVFD